MAIQQAQYLLTHLGKNNNTVFDGTGAYLKNMTAAQVEKANGLASKLDDYNNNRAKACTDPPC